MTLLFHGKIVDGVGRHSALRLPGRISELAHLKNWPDPPFPGSLNVRLDRKRLPQHPMLQFAIQGGLRCLDQSDFRPSGYVAFDQVLQNTIKPSAKRPHAGDLQIWPCSLRLLTTGQTHECFVARRVGSAVRWELELVSHCRLRDALPLSNGARVSVTMYARTDETAEPEVLRQRLHHNGGMPDRPLP